MPQTPESLTPDPGEKITTRHFAGLGYRDSDELMRMHDEESRAEASADFVKEHASELIEAILSGRQPQGQGWLNRQKELGALQSGLIRRLANKYGPVEAEWIAANVTEQTARKLLTEFAENIEQDRPY